MLCCCDSRDSETIQHTLFECKAFVEDRNEPLKRLYVIHPAARGLSDEGHCRLLTGDVLPSVPLTVRGPSEFCATSI